MQNVVTVTVYSKRGAGVMNFVYYGHKADQGNGISVRERANPIGKDIRRENEFKYIKTHVEREA